MAAEKVVVDCTKGTEKTVELTKKELAQHKADQKAGEAAQADQLRAERDARLAATDWTQLVDSPLDDKQADAWGDYRQALRDLPADTKDPAEPDWPEPPA